VAVCFGLIILSGTTANQKLLQGVAPGLASGVTTTGAISDAGSHCS